MAVIGMAAGMYSCKTTEANYRAAYQIAKDKQTDGGDSLVTAGLRNEQLPRTMTFDSIQLPVRTEPVIVTPDRGFDASHLKVYNVVAAQFKQLFNANSFCGRLREDGFDAFLVHNRDRTYYVVTLSTRSPREVAEGLARLRATDAVRLQAPFPYVLRAAQLVR